MELREAEVESERVRIQEISSTSIEQRFFNRRDKLGFRFVKQEIRKHLNRNFTMNYRSTTNKQQQQQRALGLLIAMLGLIISLSSLVDCRPGSPTTTVSHRKPPFNGSIFGKRSGAPPRASAPEPMLVVAAAQNPQDSYITESPLEVLVLMEKQREYLVAAALNQCLSGQNLNTGEFQPQFQSLTH